MSGAWCKGSPTINPAVTLTPSPSLFFSRCVAPRVVPWATPTPLASRSPFASLSSALLSPAPRSRRVSRRQPFSRSPRFFLSFAGGPSCLGGRTLLTKVVSPPALHPWLALTRPRATCPSRHFALAPSLAVFALQRSALQGRRCDAFRVGGRQRDSASRETGGACPAPMGMILCSGEGGRGKGGHNGQRPLGKKRRHLADSAVWLKPRASETKKRERDDEKFEDKAKARNRKR